MLAALGAGAQESPAPERVPSFAELEAAGARIGEVRVITQDIFDLDDPRENNALYRLANRLHINTRPDVVRHALLFKSGDPVSARVFEETERLLRRNGYLYDVSIKPVAVRDGVVDVEVRTRDTWSLDIGISASRAGGENTGRLALKEENLLGSGVTLGIGYSADVDRSGTTFEVADNNIFGTRGAIGYQYSNYDDGQHQSFVLERPFYALDARWAAGFRATDSDQLNALYNAGNEVSTYRQRRKAAEAYGGWSPGLIRGWTQRYSLGLFHEDNDYELEPGEMPPVRLPSDLTLAGPFLRFELIQDVFRSDVNLNLIGRVEDFAMGLQTLLQVGRSMTELGGTQESWVYSLNASNGFDVTRESFLLANFNAGGRYAQSSENQSVGASARYYHRQGRHILYYAALSVDAADDPDVPGPLLIGGDNGLRGYPLRYQAGERRVLATVEARAYSDWYPFRLFRVGGAVFYDTGRAWKGENTNTVNSGWLRDVGFGLRLLSARTSKGNVLHADFAFPLDPDPSINKAQFLLKTKVSF